MSFPARRSVQIGLVKDGPEGLSEHEYDEELVRVVGMFVPQIQRTVWSSHIGVLLGQTLFARSWNNRAEELLLSRSDQHLRQA